MKTFSTMFRSKAMYQLHASNRNAVSVPRAYAAPSRIHNEQKDALEQRSVKVWDMTLEDRSSSNVLLLSFRTRDTTIYTK